MCSCRLSKVQCLDRTQVHSWPRSVRSAAIWWHHGRRHSDHKHVSRSSSLDGTDLVYTEDNILLAQLLLGCLRDKSGKMESSRPLGLLDTHIPGTVLPSTCHHYLWYVLCKHRAHLLKYIRDSTCLLKVPVLHPEHTPLWHILRSSKRFASRRRCRTHSGNRSTSPLGTGPCLHGHNSHWKRHTPHNISQDVAL